MPEKKGQSYEERMQEIANTYEAPIKDQLYDISERFENSEKFRPEQVLDISDEEFEWLLPVIVGGFGDIVDIRFQILEKRVREGAGKGVSFALDLSYKGRPIGKICLYNYTPKLWVDLHDDESIESRFNHVIRRIDLADIFHVVEEKVWEIENEE